MEKLLASLFQEPGLFGDGASFMEKTVDLLKRNYQQGAFNDDSFLHTLDFLGEHYSPLIAELVDAGKRKDEELVVSKAEQILAAMNRDKVPSQVYGFFIARLLAYMGFAVDDEAYRSLAEAYRVTALEDIGSYSASPSDFLLSADGKTLERYTGAGSVVVVPFGVTTIADGVFANRDGIRYVILPNSMKRIGSGVFDNCRDLTHVYLPSGFTMVPNYFVSGAKGFHLISRRGIKAVGKYAFSGTAVPFGIMFSETESIDEGAFKLCPMVRKAVLAKTCKTVGDFAFSECKSLTEITIPGKTKIGKRAFSDAPSLKTLVAGPAEFGLECFASSGIEMASFSDSKIGKGAFSQCQKLSRVTFAGTALIGEEAFLGCPVTSLSFGPCSVGPRAFMNNARLTSVSFAEDAMVAPSAFYGCTNLKVVDFGSGNLVLGDRAFASCGLESLSLRKGDFHGWCFADNASLTKINVESDEIRFKEGILKGSAGTVRISLSSLVNQEGRNYFTMFGREPFDGAGEISVSGDAYFAPKFDSIDIKEIKVGQRFPTGLVAKRIRVLKAKRIPADLCSSVKGLETLVVGPLVEGFEPGFDASGVQILIDPENRFIHHRDGLLISPDNESVLLVLNRAEFRVEGLKGFKRIGAGVMFGLELGAFTIDSTWPVFEAKAFERCHAEKLVIKDWSRIQDDAFSHCTLDAVVVEDSSPLPSRLGFDGSLMSLDSPSLNKGYLEAMFGGAAEVERLTIHDATIHDASVPNVREAAFRRCQFTDSLVQGLELKSLLFHECMFTNARFQGCLIESLSLDDCKGQGLSFGACCITFAAVRSNAPMSLEAFHAGDVTPNIKELHVATPKLERKGFSPIDVESLHLKIDSLEDDALNQVHGKELLFDSPLRSMGDRGLHGAEFDTYSFGNDSCVQRSKDNRFLVRKADHVAFEIFGDEGRSSLCFDQDIWGYSPELLHDIQDEVTHIRIDASSGLEEEEFYGFRHLTRVETVDLGRPLSEIFPDAAIEVVTILGDRVGSHFLSSMPKLRKIDAVAPLKELGECAFAENPGLLELPDLSAVVSVGDFCFSHCSSLSSLSLPAAKTLGACPFDGMGGLTSLTVNLDGLRGRPLAFLFSDFAFPGSAEVRFDQGKHFVPERLKAVRFTGGSVPGDCFRGFEAISLTFLDPLTSAGEGAFMGLKDFQVDLSKLEVAEARCFAYAKFESLDLPSIRVIAPTAFEHATFHSLRIGPNLTSAALDLFQACRGFSSKELILESGRYVLRDGCLYDGGQLLLGLDLTDFPTHLSIPEETRSISAHALEGKTKLRSLEIPEGVSVGQCALDGLNGLDELRLGADMTFDSPIRGATNLKSLGAGTWHGLNQDRLDALLPDSKGLASVSIQKAVFSPQFFFGFDKISELVLGVKSSSLPSGLLDFPYLRRLKIIGPELLGVPHNVMPNPAGLHELDLLGCPKLRYDDFAFRDIERIKALKLAYLDQAIHDVFVSDSAFEGTTIEISRCPTICADMFGHLDNVKSLVIHDFDGVVHERAFKGLNATTELVLEKPVISVAEEGFSSCGVAFPAPFFAAMRNVGPRAFAHSVCRELDLSSTERIGEEAFAGCPVMKTHIGKDLCDLGPNAFPDVPLKQAGDFTVERGHAELDLGCLFVDGKLVHALDYPGAPTSLTLLKAKEIQRGAFGGNRARGITSLFIQGATTIDDGAFAGLAGLTSLQLGDDVVLAPHAFSGLSALHELVVDASAFSSPAEFEEAFGPIPSLTNLTAKTRLESVGFLDGCPRLESVTLTLLAEDPDTLSYSFKHPVLKNVSLAGESLVGIASDALVGTPNIETLSLLDCPYLEEGFEFLSPLKELKELSLANAREQLSIYCRESRLSKVTLGNCRDLPENAFAEMKNLTEVRFLGGALRHIGARAFAKTSVTLNALDLEGVRSIGEEAFANAEFKLYGDEAAIRLPELSDIGENAFLSCSIVPRLLLGGEDVSLHVGKGGFALADILGGIEVEQGDVVFGPECFVSAKIHSPVTVIGAHCTLENNCFECAYDRVPGAFFIIKPAMNKKNTKVARDAVAIIGEDCFKTIPSGELWLDCVLNLKSRRIFEGSKDLAVTCRKSEAEDQDRIDSEWRRFRNYGTSPGFWAKVFHTQTIKIKYL